MFKKNVVITVLGIWILLLSASCGSNTQLNASTTDNRSVDETQTILITSTSTLSLITHPTPTDTIALSTKIPIPTLNFPTTLTPNEATDEILRLITEEPGLPTPSFLGIIPGKTSIGEAKNLFLRLGIPLKEPTPLFPRATLSPRERDHYSNLWKLNNIFISTMVLGQNSLVKNLNVGVNFQDCMRLGQECDRTLYSPSYFLQKYGNPTKVTFDIGTVHDYELVDGMTPTPEYPENYLWYYMVMNYEPLNLIIAFNDARFINKPGLTICPLTDPFESVSFWMGKDPENPPYEAAPLEKVTPLTINQFSTLLLNSGPDACFPFDAEAVLPYQ